MVSNFAVGRQTGWTLACCVLALMAYPIYCAGVLRSALVALFALGALGPIVLGVAELAVGIKRGADRVEFGVGALPAWLVVAIGAYALTA